MATAPALKVLKLSNVLPDVSKLSIENTLSCFGPICSIVMLRQRCLALVEMESPHAAKEIIEFFKKCNKGFVEVDGRRLKLDYSDHIDAKTKTLYVKLTFDDTSLMPHISPALFYQIFSSYGTLEKIVVFPAQVPGSRPADAAGVHVAQPGTVCALLQFETRQAASVVKSLLDGQPAYLGDNNECKFTIHIEYSKREQIESPPSE